MSEEDVIIYREAGVPESLKTFRGCLSKSLKGESFETKEDRFKTFCVSSKLCSGMSESQAIAECLEKHPDYPWTDEERDKARQWSK